MRPAGCDNGIEKGSDIGCDKDRDEGRAIRFGTDWFQDVQKVKARPQPRLTKETRLYGSSLAR